MRQIIYVFCMAIGSLCFSQQRDNYVIENYTKIDTTIPMRDGIRLYTCIYIPKDQSQQFPILLNRTPYSCGPYGPGRFARMLGPNESLMKEKYIFVNQDVRGRFMSEGVNEEVTPYIPDKKTNKDVDESSDTYDTIEWLLSFLKNDNGRVGVYGISYPGFYATTSLPGAHPAIRAVSPQAPVTDEFIGDDVNHNGAFFLMDNFDFMAFFDRERDGPVKNYPTPLFRDSRTDAYRFFLDMKTVRATNSETYFNGKSRLWNEYLQHDTYDAYWRARNIRPHLKNISIPTLVVGGWFDAEDLFGALHTYEAIEKQSPENKNILVMGPWTHGAWSAREWTRFGTYEFGSNTSAFFRDSVETVFFNYYLKDKGKFQPAEATLFNTGTSTWSQFKSWPPLNTVQVSYYFAANKKLATAKSGDPDSYSEYLSDPDNPVPYTNGIFRNRNNEYMVEDQRFAAQRPDVIYFESDVLMEDLTLAGGISADLFVTTTGTDADFVIKLIDVLPDNEPNLKNPPRGFTMSNMQRLVRAEVFRGKFRNSYTRPEAFVPGKISRVRVALNDVLHTFKKGHRIMVQIQSSWFPLVDRNPQKFMRIPEADESDFQKARIRIYHDPEHSSKILLPVLK